MDASETSSCGAPPIRLIAVNPAGSDLATRIPTDGPHTDEPGGAGIDAAPSTADASDAPDFDKNLAVLRAGDSGQTSTATAEPAPSPQALGAADADGD